MRYGYRYGRAVAAVALGVTICLALACGGGGGGGGGGGSATRVRGTVVEIDTGTAIEDARVVLIDTGTDTQYGDTLVTDADGDFAMNIAEGQYTLHVTAQGYMDRPWKNFTPTTVDVTKGETATVTVEMIPYENAADLGSISGTVLDDTNAAVSGALVIATSGADGYSAYSQADGSYVIFNVPAGTYDLEAHLASYNATELADVVVVIGTDTEAAAITATNDATASVTGHVTFLAAENSVVDVTMVHPVTGESIPGLQTTIDETGLDYAITGVPNGTYHAFASFRNDGYVLDPDWVFKFGVPVLEVEGVDVELDFSVTDAVTLVSPTNEASTITPLDVEYAEEGDLVFEWEAYASSTAGYVIEVSDIYGTVVWGGFDEDGDRNITIDKETPTATYNSDGEADELTVGSTYQWKIYALKADNAEPHNFKLISASEDLLGLIRLVEPPAEKPR